MSPLSDVSQTALLTLRARASETRRDDPLIQDPEAVRLLESLINRLPADTGERIMRGRLPGSFTSYIALRARRYDEYVRRFREEYPEGLVVSLGAGFDTRYYRVSGKPWKYIEVDLPSVVKLKKQALGSGEEYRLIAGSVLEENWMGEIRAIQREEVLFLAEGLFMYLPGAGVRRVFERLADSFSNSEIVSEAVHAKYTRGWRKKALESKMRRRFGSEAGSAYLFGLRSAKEIEAFAPGIRVLEEWSWFEDDDIRPAIFKLFRGLKSVTRTQWTIRAVLGAD